MLTRHLDVYLDMFKTCYWLSLEFPLLCKRPLLVGYTFDSWPYLLSTRLFLLHSRYTCLAPPFNRKLHSCHSFHRTEIPTLQIGILENFIIHPLFKFFLISFNYFYPFFTKSLQNYLRGQRIRNKKKIVFFFLALLNATRTQ